MCRSDINRRELINVIQLPDEPPMPAQNHDGPHGVMAQYEEPVENANVVDGAIGNKSAMAEQDSPNSNHTEQNEVSDPMQRSPRRRRDVEYLTYTRKTCVVCMKCFRTNSDHDVCTSCLKRL